LKPLYKHIIPIIGVIILCGCLERFIPDVEDNLQRFLVVDGAISDQPGPYFVNISLSSGLDGEHTGLSGATVSIEEENGESEVLIESSPGTYETTSIQGQVGKSYRLNLTYGSRNQQYQSTWETILASSEIDSVYFEEKRVGTTDQENDISGAQFYVDTHGENEASRFYRFEWDETWRIGVRWPANYIFLGNDELTSNPDKRSVCWRYASPSGINIGTTSGLSNNFLSKHPLSFITPEGERFSRRYSLLLKQYSLSEDEYIFWKNLQESNEEIGSLFDRQPATVIGNISSMTDDGSKILGFFSASGLREYRVFVSPRQVSSKLFAISDCLALDTLLKADWGAGFDDEVFSQVDDGKVFYDFIYNEFSGRVTAAMMADKLCSDCTAKGGFLEKPIFWDE
jgi:hypothetical protein